MNTVHHSFTPPTVLVVDDHGPNRDVMVRVLGGAGYFVHAAADGREALRVLGDQRTDLYVVDYQMPWMNGRELVRWIRRRDPDAKVLYVTADCARLFDDSPLLNHNEAFLEKPFSARDLREAASLLLFGHIRGLG